MARDGDAVLLESVRVHRGRLRAAFLHGDLTQRRTTNDNARRFVGSAVLAAVICAGCAGWSFVQANVAGFGPGGLGASGTTSTGTTSTAPTTGQETP